MQETRLMENEYSINLPTKFWYGRKEWKGWINVVNPFRASMILGTPGSGKSYAVVNQLHKAGNEKKSYALYIYDFKFDDLSVIAYNHLIKYRHRYKIPPKFYVINFDNPRKSHRCNPLAPELMTILHHYTSCLLKGKQGGFFVIPFFPNLNLEGVFLPHKKYEEVFLYLRGGGGGGTEFPSMGRHWDSIIRESLN